MIHRAFGAARAAALAPPPEPPEPLELEACYRYCEAMARARHHNFPVASFFLSSHLRPHLLAIYAFARSADDFADEPQYEGRRARELDRWEDHLEATYHGEVPSHPVFVALAATVRAFDLPITPFSSLLAGFRSDLETRSYPTYQDLRSHTALAAEPVAHLCLYLAGYRDPEVHRFGGELASSMALASCWQDVPADLERGRIYLPSEDLSHFGVSAADLAARRATPAVRALIRYQVARTRAMFARARPLVDRVGDELAVEMALMWWGGMRILEKIDALGERVLRRRPRLTAYDKALVVSRAVAWRGGSLARRARRRALSRGSSLW